MQSLESFAQLVTISSSGSTTTVGEMAYSAVVIGLFWYWLILRACVQSTNIAMVRQRAFVGSWTSAEHPRAITERDACDEQRQIMLQCACAVGSTNGLSVGVQYLDGMQHFEFAMICVIVDSVLLQCGEGSCTLFEVNGTCISQCATCGTLCEAFPISDLGSLQLYKTKGCTVVVGDLYISGLPPTVTRGVLLANLQNVRFVHGDLYVRNNEFIVSMTFLENLVGLYGAHYENNPVLVDAHLPSLTQMTSNVIVRGCDRLCPARYTRA